VGHVDGSVKFRAGHLVPEAVDRVKALNCQDRRAKLT
jgi:hypothetical protein